MRVIIAEQKAERWKFVDDFDMEGAVAIVRITRSAVN